MSTPLAVALGYFHPWPNDLGFYAARALGLYERAGIDLDVRIVDPGRGDALQHLVDGAVDLAVAPTNRLFVRRSAGAEVVGIAAINQRGLETVRTRTDSGIERLADLAGRRVALNPTPRGLAVVRTLVERDGGDPDAVVIVDAGARELDPADGFGGIADATFGSYWSWDVLLTEYPQELERTWRVDEHLGVGYHSYLIAAASRLAETEPGLVRAFLEATESGYRSVIADPAWALELFDRIVPYLPQRALERSVHEVAPTWLHDGRWGVLREELLAPYAGWLAANGALDDADVWSAAIVGDRRAEARA